MLITIARVVLFNSGEQTAYVELPSWGKLQSTTH